MLNEALGAVAQVVAFTLVPLVVYLVRTRSGKDFFRYIGLVKSNRRANLLAVAACLAFAGPILLLSLTSQDFREIMFNPASVTGRLRLMGFGMESLAILVVTAVVKTSLAEEIFFRGFIAKRLIGWLGFGRGNVLQALIFGLLHAILFAMITTNAFFLLLIFFVPGFGAWIAAYINEKIAGGSIIPGWISHALANLFAYVLVGYLL